MAVFHLCDGVLLPQVRGHPNVLGILGLCESDSVSEYCDRSLDKLVLGTPVRLPILRVVGLALDAARGLQALHDHPGGAIVHYDIKPHQLMLDDKGVLKINDLNMCWFADADVNGTSCTWNDAHASAPGAYTIVSS